MTIQQAVQAIEAELQQASERLIASAIAQLAAQGIAVGKLVQHRGETYRLTKVETSVNFHTNTPHLTVWCYGNKLRRDGTFGTYSHSISRPNGLEPTRDLSQQS